MRLIIPSQRWLLVVWLQFAICWALWNDPRTRLSVYMPRVYSVRSSDDMNESVASAPTLASTRHSVDGSIMDYKYLELKALSQHLKSGEYGTFCVRYNDVRLTRQVHPHFELYVQRTDRKGRLNLFKTLHVESVTPVSQILKQEMIFDPNVLKSLLNHNNQKLQYEYRYSLNKYRQAQECQKYFDQTDDLIRKTKSSSVPLMVSFQIPLSLGKREAGFPVLLNYRFIFGYTGLMRVLTFSRKFAIADSYASMGRDGAYYDHESFTIKTNPINRRLHKQQRKADQMSISSQTRPLKLERGDSDDERVINLLQPDDNDFVIDLNQ
ncbi:hypothetical protein MIR68_010388 [Amoeboaphelidium protococcarum]|nr:hypothetical protein MIR68_010388 [Amoeboaphelidium protococcarum]